ncbi:MAG: PTS sugar transporter subunit IIA [Sphingomonadaceae bacterium]|uniref:PTS sugar transporter subunit IIA n=1 Tax=Thermaurantiacus sp. TaxID=2820283 RepID=UPI00298F2E4F|nr:PTS sugar transporter subunit IIA [Thermaurantiacus sp.]MCS6987663.1 PTS sugar transporter subunit IIA [Sphingomonadaceae bacterium]MDW8415264.1 PTS sugar transporter subunit IIA [Thermaurantiacus sp.]
MDLGDLISPAAVWADVAAASRRDALRAAARRMARRLWTSARAIETALLDREALGSTGFGGGVAIPHGRLPGLERPVAGVLRLARPVDFDSFDGQPVWLVVVLLSPEREAGQHLKALARLSRAVRAPGVRERIRGAADAAAIHAILAGRPEDPARQVA